jgi:hypothetical protein
MSAYVTLVISFFSEIKDVSTSGSLNHCQNPDIKYRYSKDKVVFQV